MTKVSFPIFIPHNKKYYLSPNWIVGIVWTVTIIFFLPFNASILHSDLKTLMLWCASLIAIWYLFSSFWSYRPMKGSLSGEILFKNDYINVANKQFKLAELTNLDFKLNDYYGKKIIILYKDFNPKISQGVDNYITFTDHKNEDQLFFFQLKNNQQYLLIVPFINEAIKEKKMSFKQG